MEPLDSAKRAQAAPKEKIGTKMQVHAKARLVGLIMIAISAFATLAAQAEPLRRRLDENGLPLTTCPGSHMREPLIANRITTTPPVFGRDRTGSEVLGDLSRLVEGRSLLLDSDSYPRRPARLVGEPVCRAQGEGYRIGFEVDGFDDVAVRAVDAEGNILFTIACGVLGHNAPAPFQKDSLEQTIQWNGRAPAGIRAFHRSRPVPAKPLHQCAHGGPAGPCLRGATYGAPVRSINPAFRPAGKLHRYGLPLKP